MVSLELKQAITEMLGTPGSVEYEAVKEIVNDRPTLLEAVEACGLTATMTSLKKAETTWIFASMPTEVAEKILQRVRVALNAGIPVVVDWERGTWNVTARDRKERGKLYLYVTTPVPDMAMLMSGAVPSAYCA